MEFFSCTTDTPISERKGVEGVERICARYQHRTVIIAQMFAIVKTCA